MNSSNDKKDIALSKYLVRNSKKNLIDLDTETESSDYEPNTDELNEDQLRMRDQIDKFVDDYMDAEERGEQLQSQINYNQFMRPIIDNSISNQDHSLQGLNALPNRQLAPNSFITGNEPFAGIQKSNMTVNYFDQRDTVHRGVNIMDVN